MRRSPADASPARRARRAVALAAALIPLAALAGCAPADPVPGADSATPPASAAPAPTASPTPTTSPQVVQGIGAIPSRVAIPAIDLDQPLIDLGIAPDGRMEVPVDFDDVGWFTGGGRPGGRGPTVMSDGIGGSIGRTAFEIAAEGARPNPIDSLSRRTSRRRDHQRHAALRDGHRGGVGR